MTDKSADSLQGVVLDRRSSFTLTEVCRACSADRRFVLELVSEGVIEPVSGSGAWQFPGEALLRARRARRLADDLGINVAGVALALELLDELDSLRQLVDKGSGP